VQLTEKGAIGNTSNDADTSNDPSNAVPTPEDHNNHRGMSNSHKDRDKSSSHKDSGNKLVEALHLPGERRSAGGKATRGAK